MGGYNVSPEGFAAMIGSLMRLPSPMLATSSKAKATETTNSKSSGVKIVLSLEGGYNLSGLAHSVEAVTRALLQGDDDLFDSSLMHQEPEDILCKYFLQITGHSIAEAVAVTTVGEELGLVHPFTIKAVARIKKDFSVYWKSLCPV